MTDRRESGKHKELHLQAQEGEVNGQAGSDHPEQCAQRHWIIAFLFKRNLV